MKTSAVVLSLLLATVAPSSLAQVPVLLPEAEVNASPAGENYSDDVALGKNGDFVVTWSAFTPGGDISGRRFDAQGAPLGGDFLVNETTVDDQLSSTIARDASGRFVVVWNHDYTHVFGRRFAADGTPLGGNFQVNTSTHPSSNYPFVAGDPSGNFVVAWTAYTVMNGAEVLARRFDSNGAPLGNNFPVNTFLAGFQSAGGVAMSQAGFVVAWRGDGPAGPGIFGRLFDPSGAPVGPQFQVNTEPLVNTERVPDVAMSAAGESVFVWDDDVGDELFALMGRRYDAAGNPAGDVFPISEEGDSAFEARVASDSAGNFVATWNSSETFDGAGTGIGARLFDAAGTPAGPPFLLNEITAGDQFLPLPSMADDGSFVIVFTSGTPKAYDVKARKSGIRARPEIEVDPLAELAWIPAADAGNGVFEPGETAVVGSAWVNDTAADVALSGTASSFTGPAGADYTLTDGTASYGTIPAGLNASCFDGGDCYSVTVSAPAVRPVPHWDTLLHELVNVGMPKTWVLHVGESFADVPTDHQFYAFIEAILHNGVTGGCFGGGYCPTNPVTRAQMAVFLLKSRFGAAHIPPPCTGTVFTDVPCTGGIFDPWIEELATLQITGGCGGGLYCPNDTVTRQQMAVFLLKAQLGSGYLPPACDGVFDDVPCPSQFADWIEDLAAHAITGGCSVTPPLYCPTDPNNRGQMAVFLVKTFGLVLYGG